MVLDKFIREAAGHFIWLLNIVFVWFKQCQHQHAAAWSCSVLLARASVKRYREGDAVCSVCSCLGSSCPPPARTAASSGECRSSHAGKGCATVFSSHPGWQSSSERLPLRLFFFFFLFPPLPSRERHVFVLPAKTTKGKKLESSSEF